MRGDRFWYAHRMDPWSFSAPQLAGPSSGARRESPMLKYAIIFGLIALVTGALGFSRVSGVAGTIAKICFAIFLILFVIAILAVIGVFHLAF